MEIKTETFKDGSAALEHAKNLLAKGEISQHDFDRVKRQLSEEGGKRLQHFWQKGPE